MNLFTKILLVLSLLPLIGILFFIIYLMQGAKNYQVCRPEISAWFSLHILYFLLGFICLALNAINV